MNRKYKLACTLMALMIVTIACLGGGLTEEEKLQTAVAQTMDARDAEQDDDEGEEPTPTYTTEPPDEPDEPAPDPDPCNHAKFISETIEDGTDFDPNDNFTKTWRLKNDGTCTWNTNYKVVFVDGDQMSGPANKNLTQSVAPGEQVDISVDLKAPGSEGTYKGFWKVADDEGQYFVHNIWVEIEVIEPAAPPAPTKADLIVSGFILNPATPTMGENVHVRVSVENQGETDAGSFKTQWYGLTTFTNPSCHWDPPGVEAGHSILLECDFVFASWYPHNKTTIVNVDVNDSVDESNEGNNSATISPFGVNAP